MYKKPVIYLIILCAVIRLFVAGMVELGNDEVYYYTYALHLQQNYFDHPPAVALLIRFFTLNLHLHGDVFVRLGSVVCAAVGTWLAFSIGVMLRSQRTGWFAALLYNTSIYSSLIAGTFILPDSPQVVAWLASLLILLKIAGNSNNGQKASYGQWLLFGLLAGVCIMCKVHGAFLWVGLGLYALFFNRKMLLHPGLYLAFIVTLIVISPIFVWNIENNFITWRYHSQRVTVQHFSLNTDGFIQAFFGQIFYNNPFNVFIIIMSVLYVRKNKILPGNITPLLLLCGLPIILFVTGIALFRDVLPHWSGPGFVTLSFIAAAYLDDVLQSKPSHYMRIITRASITLMFIVVIGGVWAINFYPGTIGSNNYNTKGDGDFTLDLHGWQQFGSDFNAWQADAVAQHAIAPGLPIVCNKWFPAAHIDYYVAAPANTYVVGIGELNDLHQFVWLNQYRKKLNAGDDALCIIPSNYPQNIKNGYGAYFQSATLLNVFVDNRGGQPARVFELYLLKGYKANDEAHGYKVM